MKRILMELMLSAGACAAENTPVPIEPAVTFAGASSVSNMKSSPSTCEISRSMEALYRRCEKQKSGIAKIRSQIMDKAGRGRNVEAYLQRISRTEPLTVFDESVFRGTGDCVIARRRQGKTEKQLIFRFKDGTEIPMTV